MKVNTNELKKALKKVVSITKTKIIYNIESNVRVVAVDKELCLYATDNTTNLKISISPESVDDEFDVLVNADKLYTFVNACKEDTIQLLCDEKVLCLIAANYEHKLICGGSEGFPTFEKDSEMLAGIALNKEMKNTILKMKPFIGNSKEDFRPFLRGVYFRSKKDGLDIVALDGKHASVVKWRSAKIPEGDLEYTIPFIDLERCLKQIDANATIQFYSDYVLLADKNSVWNILTIEGKYPPYEQVMPCIDSYDTTITFNKKEMVSAVDGIKGMLDKSKRIELHIENEHLVVKATNQDYGESAAYINAITNMGEQSRIALNYEFLLNVIGAAATDTVTMYVRDDKTPLTILPENKSSGLLDTKSYSETYIIMPMRWERPEA